MVRILVAAGMFLVASVVPALSATVEGKLFSIDAVGRTITFEDGAILKLTDYVVLDGLMPGQLVRVTYADETIDATAIDILENAPVEPLVESTGMPTDYVSDPSPDLVTDPGVEVAQ